MKNRRNEKIVILCSMAVILSMICGCGVADIPELTEEQHEQVVEYATGLLLKYDTENENKLLSEGELSAGIAEAEEKKAKEEARAEAVAEKKAQEEAGKIGEAGADPADPSGVNAVSNLSMSEFFSLGEISLQYTGSSVNDFYPENNTEDEYFFVVNATSNNKLLVLKFTASNQGTQEALMDMVSQKAAFAIRLNGTTSRNALLTMMLNDLCEYQGTLQSGETKELVLVFEIPQEETTDISSIELMMKNVDNSATISLQ